MKYMMKATMPTESANLRIKDPQFGKKMHEILADVKAAVSRKPIKQKSFLKF